MLTNEIYKRAKYIANTKTYNEKFGIVSKELASLYKKNNNTKNIINYITDVRINDGVSNKYINTSKQLAKLILYKNTNTFNNNLRNIHNYMNKVNSGDIKNNNQTYRTLFYKIKEYYNSLNKNQKLQHSKLIDRRIVQKKRLKKLAKGVLN